MLSCGTTTTTTSTSDPSGPIAAGTEQLIMAVCKRLTMGTAG
ncbi:MAG TPA: hypothetical protein VFZ67_01625 [Nitrososphaera sp.]